MNIMLTIKYNEPTKNTPKSTLKVAHSDTNCKRKTRKRPK